MAPLRRLDKTCLDVLRACRRVLKTSGFRDAGNVCDVLRTLRTAARRVVTGS